MGPMSVRVASYFPFNVACYMNGHSFVAQELTRADAGREPDPEDDHRERDALAEVRST